MRGRPLSVEAPAGALGALVAGLLVGTLGTFKHQAGIDASTGTGLPYGLVLALAMVAAVLLALRVAFGTRLYAANERSGDVTWFDVDPADGIPRLAGSLPLPAVSCVLFD